MNWQQPQCERCWIAKEFTATSSRMPVRVMTAQVEQCAWCGGLTVAGIYRRADPRMVLFPAAERQEDGDGDDDG